MRLLARSASLVGVASTTVLGLTVGPASAAFDDRASTTLSAAITGTYDSYYATQNIQVTVIARTSYGWTAESAKSGVIKC